MKGVIVRIWGRIRLVIITLLLLGAAILLASRGGDDARPHTELLPGHSSDAGSETRTTDAAYAQAPHSESLVMIQGLKAQRLVIWPLNGSAPPLEIDRQVTLWPLLPSPDGGRVLYGTQHTVMVLDVAARRAIIAGTLPPNGRLVYAQWSPDSRALAYVVQTPAHFSAYYTRADGTTEAALMVEVPTGLELDVGWLADGGDPVSISLGVGPRGGLETIYYRYHPPTGKITMLPPDTAIVQPWSPLRAPDGQRQVFAMKSWDESRYSGACHTGPLGLAGPEWLPLALRTLGYKIEVAFEIDGLFMDRPTWLDDGRIVFRTTADPVCTALDSGFYAGEVGKDPVKLVSAEPRYVADAADKVLWTASYALSPDQARIAWNENDYDTQRSRVLVAPLDSAGDVTTLFDTAKVDTPDAPFAFQDEVMILYFIWLP